MKIKNNALFITTLVLAIAVCFSVASAKAQDEKQVNGNDKQLNGEAHRSAVSTFVQGLLKAAAKEKGTIGEEVATVAQAQSDVKDAVADSIDKIQNRSKVKTFFIGTDYKNVGQLRSEMVKTQNQIDQLKRLADKATSAKIDLQGQIQSLEQQWQKIETFLKANEGKFSLFGWFAKLFVK